VDATHQLPAGRIYWSSPSSTNRTPTSYEGRTSTLPRTKQAPAVIARIPKDAGDDADPVRELRSFRWGLVPFWAKDIKIDSRMANARAETMHEKPAFRTAFRSLRALFPVDAFYEWMEADQPGKSGKPSAGHHHRPPSATDNGRSVRISREVAAEGLSDLLAQPSFGGCALASWAGSVRHGSRQGCMEARPKCSQGPFTLGIVAMTLVIQEHRTGR
jgi:hypothetical protein